MKALHSPNRLTHLTGIAIAIMALILSITPLQAETYSRGALSFEYPASYEITDSEIMDVVVATAMDKNDNCVVFTLMKNPLFATLDQSTIEETCLSTLQNSASTIQERLKKNDKGISIQLTEPQKVEYTHFTGIQAYVDIYTGKREHVGGLIVAHIQDEYLLLIIITTPKASISEELYSFIYSTRIVPPLPPEPEYTKGDTILLDEDFEIYPSKEAFVYYGIVSSLDTTNNTANIRVFTRSDNTLAATEHRVASGKHIGLLRGAQRYYTPDLKVKRLAQYVLVTDETGNEANSRLVSDKLFYDDGKTLKEDITYTNLDKPNDLPTYIRKCYYPSGVLQFEDTYDGKSFQLHYYNEKGKEINNPKQPIEPLVQMPEFPGGQNALFKYLSQTVKYPAIAKENKIQGRVLCQFVVNKDGSISDIEVIQSGGDASLDKEALRVIKSMPKWKPGKLNGEPVRVKYVLPITFKL